MDDMDGDGDQNEICVKIFCSWKWKKICEKMLFQSSRSLNIQKLFENS